MLGLTAPILTKTELTRAKSELKLEFADIPGATGYTVIFLIDTQVYQLVELAPGERVTRNVRCDDCYIAIRTVKDEQKGAFTEPIRPYGIVFCGISSQSNEIVAQYHQPKPDHQASVKSAKSNFAINELRYFDFGGTLVKPFAPYADCRVKQKSMLPRQYFNCALSISVSDNQWVQIQEATYNRGVLSVISKSSMDILKINTTSGIREFEAIYHMAVVSVNEEPIQVQGDNGPWFDVRIIDEKQPVIVTAKRYGDTVFIEMEKNAAELTPLYEGHGFCAEGVNMQTRWYGYYGRFLIEPAPDCNLFIRKIFPNGMLSVFSKPWIIPESSETMYFDVVPTHTGYSLQLLTEKPVIITYTNTLNSKSTQISSDELDPRKRDLSNLDQCTPYRFEGHLVDSSDGELRQTLTMVTQPEIPEVTEFKAISPTETFISAQFLTRGHCALIFWMNGGRGTDQKKQQVYGSPFTIRLRPETGTIVDKREKFYDVRMNYTIYETPPCGKRFLSILPFLSDQMITTNVPKKRLEVEPYDLQISVNKEDPTTYEIRVLNPNPCVKPHYRYSFGPKEDEKTIKYVKTNQWRVSTTTSCSPCELTVEPVETESAMKKYTGSFTDKIS
ncbi:unnamed protein product [Echinostoma caproni]|uniref:IgGFc_binding domain-containing protein n=1 Tax=Echinostoma caproni TaxID=27848 RepID=A0A183ALT0_9TREM|nr:unnamed protein product [Echinostoma caproni]